MPSTIRDLTELTTVAVDDYILISDTSDVVNRDKRISKANFSGGTLTGGGTLATGGFTLTVPATGVAVLKAGTPVASRVAMWTDANSLQSSGYLVTDLASLNTAQTFSALKTFSAGLSFGADTLSLYSTGAWTPVLAFGGGTTGIVYSVQSGMYVRIGGVTHATCRIVLTNKGSSTGAATIQGLPIAPTQNYVASVYWVAMATAWATITGVTSGTDIVLRGATAAAVSSGTSLTNADFGNTSEIRVSATYM